MLLFEYLKIKVLLIPCAWVMIDLLFLYFSRFFCCDPLSILLKAFF